MRVYWKVDGTKNGVDEYKNATYEQIEIVQYWQQGYLKCSYLDSTSE